MPDKFIVLPVLVQVCLTLGLYIYLIIVKSSAAKRGEVNEARRALYEDAWPDSVRKVNNAIRNQFEVPVLFYVLVWVFWSAGIISIYFHVLAWLFVLSRLAHVSIHIGSNYVPLRRRYFSLGCLLLSIMALWAFVAVF